ncbi:ATP-binding protein [Roseimaritima sediminicola]|uniref:ATP-binding protein n=1 Tax=Roseimaritima sediminicola TaxID=2662066 RepID=UPI0012983F27|nr:ATP-binding protein [Roseimaritima sediminicola]
MTQKIELEVGPDIIRSYKRLGYRAWYALAEFLDNSTQSFFDHRDELNKAAADGVATCEIAVSYDKKHKLLRIHDTAMGMSRSELANALKLGKPPAKTDGRSEFGLGLKTAACWFGDAWKITSKRLGEDYEIEVEVNVERVAAGNLNLNPVERPKAKDLHYTTVEISKMHRPLHHQTIKSMKTYLQSMYRVDIRNGTLVITFQGGEPLAWDDELNFIVDREGTPYKKDFDEAIEGKRVHGWIGVLQGGARRKAGFAQIRRGRVIQGQPEAWRPENIFGINRNNLLNQRLIGEINLDEFGVSHTKDAILWHGDEESKVQEFLATTFGDYIEQANKTYKSQGEAGGPKSADVQVAMNELKNRLESPDFVDAIELTEIPSEDVIKDSNQHVVDAVSPGDPDLTVKLGPNEVRVYLAHDLSPQDPYFASDTAGDVIVSINCNHVHWQRIDGADSVLRYLLECVYDAVAEWKCSKKSGAISHDTIKWIKDGLLRLDIGSVEEDGDPES